MVTTPAAIKRKTAASISVEVELLTPQFGGGVRAREADAELWLRPSAVKGALRFWWRALYGHAHADLLEAESGLFGGTAPHTRPSRVEFAVRPTFSSRTVGWSPEQGDPLSGAYFPGAGMGGQAAAGLLQPGARAMIQLTLTGLDARERAEVIESLRAYLVFGGSGARTRRTAGALGVAAGGAGNGFGLPSTLEDLDTWLRVLPRVHPVRPDYFSLVSPVSVFRTKTAYADPFAAQKHLLEFWRDFRQDRPHPATWRGAVGWGRSTWPEADLIRTARATWAVWADGTSHAPVIGSRTAPRAHLGLPIVFHFKDVRIGSTHPIRGRLVRPDPAGGDLVGDPHLPDSRKIKRYASPVLLSVCRLPGHPGPTHVGIVLITPSLLASQAGIDASNKWSPGPWSEVDSRLQARLTVPGSGFVKVV